MESKLGSTTLITLIICGAVSLFLPGCMVSGGWDYFEAGTTSGIRSKYEGMNGLVTNARTPSGRESEYYKNMRHREEEETKRVYAPTWLDGLFGRGKRQETAQMEGQHS